VNTRRAAAAQLRKRMWESNLRLNAGKHIAKVCLAASRHGAQVPENGLQQREQREPSTHNTHTCLQHWPERVLCGQASPARPLRRKATSNQGTQHVAEAAAWAALTGVGERDGRSHLPRPHLQPRSEARRGQVR
jgi:hypothetical protein